MPGSHRQVFPENTANTLLFDQAIIAQLLLPLQHELERGPAPSPALLLIVADLLARIANVPAGRYGNVELRHCCWTISRARFKALHHPAAHACQAAW